MNNNEEGMGVLKSLGFSCVESINEEQMEFMINLMDTSTAG